MPNTPTQRKRPPKDLANAEKALWRNITEQNSFDAAEYALLHLLCRTIDVLERINTDLADMGVVVAGSTGQPKVNPDSVAVVGQVSVSTQPAQSQG